MRSCARRSAARWRRAGRRGGGRAQQSEEGLRVSRSSAPRPRLWLSVGARIDALAKPPPTSHAARDANAASALPPRECHRTPAVAATCWPPRTAARQQTLCTGDMCPICLLEFEEEEEENEGERAAGPAGDEARPTARSTMRPSPTSGGRRCSERGAAGAYSTSAVCAGSRTARCAARGWVSASRVRRAAPSPRR